MRARSLPPRPAVRTAAGAALLLALAMPAAPAARAAGATPAGVGQLEREYREHRLAVRPDLATRAGDRRGDGRLEPVTEATLLAETEWLRAFAARLEAVARDGLPPAQRAARDSLTARVARARTELEITRRWERDPAAYLDLADHAVRDLLEGSGATACARARAAARRLARVPDVLRAARVNLRQPPRDLLEDALPRYERLLELYRVDLPAFGAACREPHTQADLAEADSAAVRAVEGFLGYLRDDLLPRATAGPGR